MSLRLLPLGGSGPKLLLVHGFGADRMTWIANQDALQQVGEVYACDLPAHGDQAPFDVQLDISSIVEAMIDSLEATGNRFILIGHSLGGAISIELASRRPDLVRGLMLITPAGLGHGIDRTFLNTFPNLSDTESALALLRRLVVRPQLITRQIAQRVIAHLNRQSIRQAMRDLGQELLQIELAIEPHLATIAASNIPRAVIWGEGDQINPLNHSKLSAFKAPVISLPNTGHLPHIEAFRTVNQRLCEFVQRE